MQNNLVSIIVLILCFLLPYSLVMLTIAIISTRSRWKEAKEISENLNNPADVEKLLPVPRRYLPIFISVSLTLIGSLICLMGIMIAHYLDLPVIRNISSATLGSLSIAVILAGTTIVIGFVIFDKIYKMKK